MDLQQAGDLRYDIDEIPATQPIIPSPIPGQPFVSNDPLDLVIATIDGLQRNQLTPKQRQGLNDWLTLWPHLLSDPNGENGPDLWSGPEITKLTTCFIKMFFHPDMDFALTDVSWAPGLQKNHRSLGKTAHVTNPYIDAGRPYVRMIVDPDDCHRELRCFNRVASISSVILHEAIHAYLFMFCCDKYHSPNDSCTRKGKLLWPSGKGHCLAWFHLAWFHLACHIELTMPLIANNFVVNLSVMQNYVWEVKLGELQFFAPEWRRFFHNCGWEGACKLFDRLTVEEERDFGKYLLFDRQGMQVCAEEGEKH